MEVSEYQLKQVLAALICGADNAALEMLTEIIENKDKGVVANDNHRQIKKNA